MVNDFGGGVLRGDDRAAAAGPYPDGAPITRVRTDERDDQEPTGVYLWASAATRQGFWRVIVDRAGRLVWAQQNEAGEETFYARVAYDGRALLWDSVNFEGGVDDSRVVRAQIDGAILDPYDVPGHHHAFTELAEALVEVWSFGVGDGITAPYMGEPHRLLGGNTLQNYGSTPRARETSSGGEVVWDIEWTDIYGQICTLIGRSVLVEDLYDFTP